MVNMVMKLIRIFPRNEHHVEYIDDITRIVTAMGATGYLCSPAQAQLMWEAHSDSMCAGWLVLPKSDMEIVNSIARYFEVI